MSPIGAHASAPTFFSTCCPPAPRSLCIRVSPVATDLVNKVKVQPSHLSPALARYNSPQSNLRNHPTDPPTHRPTDPTDPTNPQPHHPPTNKGGDERQLHRHVRVSRRVGRHCGGRRRCVPQGRALCDGAVHRDRRWAAGTVRAPGQALFCLGFAWTLLGLCSTAHSHTHSLVHQPPTHPLHSVTRPALFCLGFAWALLTHSPTHAATHLPPTPAHSTQSHGRPSVLELCSAAQCRAASSASLAWAAATAACTVTAMPPSQRRTLTS